jgi:hypothetical protein
MEKWKRKNLTPVPFKVTMTLERARVLLLFDRSMLGDGLPASHFLFTSPCIIL